MPNINNTSRTKAPNQNIYNGPNFLNKSVPEETHPKVDAKKDNSDAQKYLLSVKDKSLVFSVDTYTSDRLTSN